MNFFFNEELKNNLKNEKKTKKVYSILSLDNFCWLRVPNSLICWSLFVSFDGRNALLYTSLFSNSQKKKAGLNLMLQLLMLGQTLTMIQTGS